MCLDGRQMLRLYLVESVLRLLLLLNCQQDGQGRGSLPAAYHFATAFVEGLDGLI